jgi:hypothetical protein
VPVSDSVCQDPVKSGNFDEAAGKMHNCATHIGDGTLQILQGH